MHIISVEHYISIAAVLFLLIGFVIGRRKKDLTAEIPVNNDFDLSPREMEVLYYMSIGLSNQEIGEKLFVSLNTVKTHLKNIYGKMGVNRRTQAVQIARRSGMIKS